MAQRPREVNDAVARTHADGNILTRDQGGSASTTEFCEAIAAQLD